MRSNLDFVENIDYPFGEVTVHRSAVRSNLDFVENIDYPVWRGGRAVDKFAGSKFGQRSVSGAGPAGVTYREVGHSAPVCGA